MELTGSQIKKLAPLFAYTQETMALSCLQGHMGRAWADDPENPTCALMRIGDFSLLAGRCESDGAPDLIKAVTEGRNTFILVAPEHEDWSAMLEAAYGDRARRFERYAIRKEPDCFDRQKLRRFIDELPPYYELAPIGPETYEQVAQNPELKDFVSQFASLEDYLQRGIGFCVLYKRTVVGGASSYTIYDGGIEIEICTLSEHRRKGLATAVAARLILACLDRGLYPSWDAANQESVALAEKLGYHFDHAYTTYIIEC